MKKLWITLPLVAALFGAACVKVANEASFKADNTATMKMTVGYKLDAVEGLKGLISQFGGGDEEGEDGPSAKIDEALKMFDEKKIVEGAKKGGFEVAKSATVEKDGWKLVELEGAIKDVNAWLKKSGETAKNAMKESKDGPKLDELPLTNLAVHFYKVEGKPDMAKLVIIPPLAEALPPEAEEGLSKMDDLPEDQKEQVEQMVNMVRQQVALDEMRVEMKLHVPGKIQSVKGCKQDGEDGLVFAMKGSDISIDGLKNLFGLKEGVYATFQFDPKTMKITLEDEPKAADSKPAKKVEAPAKEKKNEEEKKGGGDGG